MLELYEKYLDNITLTLNNFFEQQKPYIFCKEGCSACCETGEYPFTELELNYAMQGYINLSETDKKIVQKKVEQVKKDKARSKEKVFMHECPFLIEKKCSIYKYRAIICRTHGLMYYEGDKSVRKLPSCVFKGLNYSNVFDSQTRMISSEKWKESGIETEPVSYNIGLDFLTNNETTKALELNFGEAKALIDWF